MHKKLFCLGYRVECLPVFTNIAGRSIKISLVIKNFYLATHKVYYYKNFIPITWGNYKLKKLNSQVSDADNFKSKVLSEEHILI